MDNQDLTQIVLGEEFPLKQYVQLGDFTSAFLTSSSFDVIISLTDLTEEEEYAIADEEFDVYFVDTEFGPLVVFQFGDDLRFDFSLNIHKMNQAAIPAWLRDPDETVRVYVLEGSDSVVKAVRFVPFKKMYDLKVSCMRQLNKTKTEVDTFIHKVYAQYSIQDLINNAQYHFSVPATESSL